MARSVGLEIPDLGLDLHGQIQTFQIQTSGKSRPKGLDFSDLRSGFCGPRSGFGTKVWFWDEGLDFADEGLDFAGANPDLTHANPDLN